MADIKISQLGAAATISDSDVFPMTANGITVKAAASLIKEYAIGDDDISALGDGSPTGAILALNANKSAKSDIAMIEESVAIASHAIGAEFYLSGVLMKATAAIAIGDQIVNGTNCAPADDVSSQIQALANRTHNIPRLVPKDITSYVTDGTLWKRLNGTDGYTLFEDIYVGDYIEMSRAISAYNQDQQYQATGTKWVTIAGIDWYMQDGDNAAITYHHLVMVPGKGFDTSEAQHFGRSRMNASDDITGGYTSSEMNATTIGAVVSAGSTASTATINQQLYAEFSTHLKTTRELLSNAIDSARYNRFGQASGATSGWAWANCQAVLMSEIEVYGSIVFSSSGQDTGNACRQLPLFAHSKIAQNNRSAYYWLKDVASAAYFCYCADDGYAGYGSASGAFVYVRPRFILA